MAKSRPKGILALGWACLESAVSGRTEHRPTSADYPDTVVRRVTFFAGGGLGWRLSALTTPRASPAPWKIVVVTGSPSWAEYWAPVLAALPRDREMIVVDRPGFAGSEPAECVTDIHDQASALSPLLTSKPGQQILLVGQSYGAAIAALMAAAQPGRVAAIALLSSYLGQSGPTAQWLVRTGSRFLNLIPRDLRNAVIEVSRQPSQMTAMREAMGRIRAPIYVIHGDQDDFAPMDAARELASSVRTRHPMRFQCVAGANHFLNDGPVDTLLDCLEACIPAAKPAFAWRWPDWRKIADRQSRQPLGAAAFSS
jgi:pimeloyl-ACP methyl ester carboxylesterase